MPTEGNETRRMTHLAKLNDLSMCETDESYDIMLMLERRRDHVDILAKRNCMRPLRPSLNFGTGEATIDENHLCYVCTPLDEKLLTRQKANIFVAISAVTLLL